MPSENQRIGDLVRRGVLLFSQSIPLPAPTLVSAIAAAVIAKALDLRDARISDVLGRELSLGHVPRIQPDDKELMLFYANNPLYPELAAEFEEEFLRNDFETLRRYYPLLHNALVLRREIPSLLFHEEIERRQFRKMALLYDELSRGYHEIEGDPDFEESVNRFATELLLVLSEVYEAVRDDLKDKENRAAFDIIDYIREVAFS